MIFERSLLFLFTTMILPIMLALPCDKKSSVLNQAFLNTSFQSPNVIRWPDAPCNIVFNGVESKTGQYKIATKSEFLFDYTNSKLRKLYKEKSFMETKASFVALNNKLYLVLNIRIHSKDAPLTYGQISSGSTLKLIFMNGNEKYIKCSSTAAGQLRLQKKKYNTDYEVFYRLEKESIDMISKLDLDKIGIMWSSGFEEYEIYYLDLLKNQINCILNS